MVLVLALILGFRSGARSSAPFAGGALLLEDSASYLLLEDGSKLLLG